VKPGFRKCKHKPLAKLQVLDNLLQVWWPDYLISPTIHQV